MTTKEELRPPTAQPYINHRKGYSYTFLLRLASCCILYAANSAHAQITKPATWVGNTFKGAPCRGRDQGFGPYDYTLRSGLQDQLRIVETAHFTPGVESLQKGNRGRVIQDLDYTLRAWPNHHRALYSVIRYGLNKQGAFSTSETPTECYLQRAVNYSPNDSKAHMLFGLFLHKSDRKEEALKFYRKSLELDENSILAKYNLALLLVDLKQYDEAETLAEEVYRNKFPLPGLKRKLKER